MVKTRQQARGRRDVFPFLRLPAELREEIYKLTLGSRFIHVGFRVQGLRSMFRFDETRLCSATPQENDMFGRKPIPESPDYESRIAGRHEGCDKTVEESMSLALLLTCKEIYNEAKGVIFRENVFGFRCHDRLTKFLEKLGERALQIRHILLVSANATRRWQCDPESISQLPMKKLRSVGVWLEICPADVRGDPTNLLRREHQDALFGGLAGLKTFNPQKLHIAIRGLPFEAKDVPTPSQDELKLWEARIRRLIMPTSSEPSEADQAQSAGAESG